MSDFEPLNPALYRNLCRAFGKVLIANEGIAFDGHYVPRFPDPGESMYVEDYGETYRVSCDVCNDTRCRLYVPYMFGKRDDRNRLNLFLAKCYNEHCYEKSGVADNLYEKLSFGQTTLRDARVLPGVERTEAPEVPLPGPITPLHELPPDHPANRYLAMRFINPELVSRFYGVGYCTESNYFLAKHRIYIPVIYDGLLKGWQARHVGDLDWKDKGSPCKYFNAPDMLRGRVLYNLHRAKEYQTGVVVEGVMKAWNIGPMCMATLGWPITTAQQHILVPTFKKRSLVLLLDPDVTRTEVGRKKVAEVHENLSGHFNHGVAVIVPPAPPDEMDRMWLRDFITQEAKGQDVKVSWGLA